MPFWGSQYGQGYGRPQYGQGYGLAQQERGVQTSALSGPASGPMAGMGMLGQFGQMNPSAAQFKSTRPASSSASQGDLGQRAAQSLANFGNPVNMMGGGMGGPMGALMGNLATADSPYAMERGMTGRNPMTNYYTVPGEEGGDGGFDPGNLPGGGGTLPKPGGTQPGSTDPEGPKGPPVDPGDFPIETKNQSSSEEYSGPPEWLAGLLEQIGMGKFGLKRATDTTAMAMKNWWRKSGKRIENARQGEVRQFQRDIRNPLAQNMQNQLLQAGGAGVLGSSVMGDYLSRMAEQGMKAGQQVHEAANVRAENRQLGRLAQAPQMGLQYSGMLGNLMGLSRFGEGQSQSSGYSFDPTLIAQIAGLLQNHG